MPKRTGAEVLCKQCGVPFYVPAWKSRSGQGVYCSQECMGLASRGKAVPWARPNEKTMHPAGYFLIWMPEHPRASRGRVLEQIVVAEQKLGRPIGTDEHVHHIDGDKTNNHPDNLEVLSNAEHQRRHLDRPIFQKKRVTVACEECGGPFEVKPYQVNPVNPENKVKYCSKECRYKAYGRKHSAFWVEWRKKKSEGL